jgi:small conductance mechanosensitive channel
MWDSIYRYTSGHWASIEHAGWSLVKIVILILAAKIAIKVLTRITARAIQFHGKMEERRRNTLNSLFGNLVRYTVYFILLLTILPIFGVQIGALLAGAGVVGITIAFGAQTLIKDFFNGFFILFEDQFGVGDYVLINNISGKIHSVGLRLTTIKIWTGEIVFIPNSQITQVTNYSKDNSIAVIDVNIGYSTDVEKAAALLRQVMETLKEEDPNIVGEVSVLGVQALNDSNYTLRATAECLPLAHWSVQRLARQRIRAAFANEGVDLPLQKIVYLHDRQGEKSGQ